MTTYQVCVVTTEYEAEELSAWLIESGFGAVEIRDQQMIQLPGVSRPPAGEAFVLVSVEAPSEALAQEQVLAGLRDCPNTHRLGTCEALLDIDWAHQWKAFFHPLRIGDRLWVVPSWEQADLPQDACPVVLDPEMAFGTGNHPTTRLCLLALEQWIACYASHSVAVASSVHVLDVGTGSGILAIAAAKLANLSVVAIDNDAPSVETARVNAEKNACSALVQCLFLDLLEQTEQETVAREIVMCKQPYPLILANILKEPLIAMAQTLVNLLAHSGTLIVSGILNHQVDAIVETYLALGLSVQSLLKEDEWSAVVFVKKS